MRLTLSVLKADIGSNGGHTKPSAEMIEVVTRVLKEAQARQLIIDYFISYTGDDIALTTSYLRGPGDHQIHQMAWRAFKDATLQAQVRGLYAAGQDLLADAPSGNIRGAGPAVAEIEFEHSPVKTNKVRPAESFMVFAADKKQRGKDAQFLGDWPIFTRDYVIKPAYNAFTALSIFAGKQEAQLPSQLEISAADDYFVTAAASQTKDKRTTRVLLSNFVPSAEVAGARDLLSYLGPVLKSCMLAKGYSEEEYKSIIASLQAAAKKNPPQGGMTLAYVTRLIEDTIPDPKTREDILWCVKNDVLEMKQDIDRYGKEPREVEVSLSGLAAGSYRIKKYLIDQDHSNSCRYNKKTESQSTNTPCGINGQIDQRVARAKQEAEHKGKEAGFAYLRKQGYTDRDLELGKQIVQSCKRKMACIQEELQKRYKELDRCKKAPCAADTVISELETAIKIYRDTHAQVFFYDSPDSIDKINNMKEVRLDVTEQTTAVINDGVYRHTLNVAPHSVLLIEIEHL